MKAGTEGVPTLEGWLEKNMDSEQRVAIDSRITPIAQYKRMLASFKSKGIV